MEETFNAAGTDRSTGKRHMVFPWQQDNEGGKAIPVLIIEDETGIANLVIFQKLFDEYRKPILQSRLIMVEGKLQIEGEVIHVIVSRCYDFSKLLPNLTAQDNEDLPLLTMAQPSEKSILPKQNKDPQVRKEKVFTDARNFR